MAVAVLKYETKYYCMCFNMEPEFYLYNISFTSYIHRYCVFDLKSRSVAIYKTSTGRFAMSAVITNIYNNKSK